MLLPRRGDHQTYRRRGAYVRTPVRLIIYAFEKRWNDEIGRYAAPLCAAYWLLYEAVTDLSRKRPLKLSTQS